MDFGSGQVGMTEQGTEELEESFRKALAQA